MATRYRILVAGSLTPTARDMLAGLDISPAGEHVVLTGDLDQAALHGVLERLRALALDIVEVRHLGPRPRRATSHPAGGRGDRAASSFETEAN